MASTDKEEVKCSFNLKTSRNSTMHTSLYYNISELYGNLEGIINDRTYKTILQNMHKLFWKTQFFNSADVSMLGRGCGVSQYPQFYDRIKKYISNFTMSICGNLFR